MTASNWPKPQRERSFPICILLAFQKKPFSKTFHRNLSFSDLNALCGIDNRCSLKKGLENEQLICGSDTNE